MHDAAEARRHVRVKCGFMIRVPGGALVPTYGDVSSGGAKFTVADPLAGEVEVLAGELAVKATVLQVLQGGGQFTYRVKFEDERSGARVFESIYGAA